MGEFQPIIINRENGLAFRSYITAESFATLLNKGRYGVGVLAGDGRAAGALTCAREGDELVIDSIFVDKAARGRGAGTLLVDAAKTLSRKTGTVLSASYAYPARRELHMFFQKMGFIGPAEGNGLFAVPFQAIEGSGFLNKDFPEASGVIPFREAPKQAVLEYRARVGADIPAFASLERAQGEPIPEATLVSLKDGRICAFIVSTVLADGGIYLNSLYAEKSHAKVLNALVQKALRALCDRGGGDGALYVAAHNDAGLKIIEHLLKILPEGTATRNTVHSMVFYPEDERNVEEMEELRNRVPSLDFIMPKLSGLSDLMADLGIGNDIIVQSGAPPYISVNNGEDVPEIRLSYIPADDDDIGKYVLSAVTAFTVPDDSDTSAAVLCSEFNTGTIGPFAHTDALGDVIYVRSNLPEKDVPVSEGAFGFFWELFLTGIDDIKTMTADESGAS